MRAIVIIATAGHNDYAEQAVLLEGTSGCGTFDKIWCKAETPRGELPAGDMDFVVLE